MLQHVPQALLDNEIELRLGASAGLCKLGDALKECCTVISVDTRTQAGICFALLAGAYDFPVDLSNDLLLPVICDPCLEDGGADLLLVDGAISDIHLSSLLTLEHVAKKGYACVVILTTCTCDDDLYSHDFGWRRRGLCLLYR